MSGSDPSFICHLSSVNSAVNPISQRKRKLGAERRSDVAEEMKKLLDVSFIKEIPYPTLFSNVVLVRKANGKWHMCVDFTYLNTACPKDPYPVPSIDGLIDGA